MDLTHIRTENGTTTLIATRAALDEVQAVMSAGHDDGTELYGSGSTYAITYPDGRRVTVRPATAQEIETHRAQADDQPANLRTHTGTVHRKGSYSKRLRTHLPACCASESAARRLHFLIPTTEDVTCQRC
ncbi:hypothetical protein ACGFZP_12895 [Kitasatospora sp. NPDC048239]|uniref:hypothetical protein n=1 Tax=Kitasatospora sp. NPDC048239 TaxID=3364046 RepID=UPI003719CB96